MAKKDDARQELELTIKTLQSKVRKLQKENRELKADLVCVLKRNTELQDVNSPLVVATDVDTKGASHAEFGDSEPEEVEVIETTAPIQGEN